MSYELKIEKITNGFILSWFEEREEIEGEKFMKEEKEVIEEADTEKGEKEVMIKLLYRIAEYFGILYDKWEEDNLNIKFNKKGHKLE